MLFLFLNLHVLQSSGYFVGISYAVLWYGSILLGFYFLYAPLLPLLFINRRLYRKITDTLYSSWESFNVSLLQGLYGVRIVLTGDGMIQAENALFILNHSTRLDWNFFWMGLHHAGPNHNAKIILKDEVKKIPGIGWIMSMTRFIYLKRSWSQDKDILDSMLDYFHTIKDEDPKQLILFPEGTNLNSKTRARSDAFAKKNNRHVYHNVLHPRTTGFVHVTKGMAERGMLDAVYDVTLAYPDNKPETEMSLLKGQMPSKVNIHMVRHPVHTLPSTYIGLEKWLEERWRDKENALDQFYTNPQQFVFPTVAASHQLPRKMTQLQPLCLVLCSLLMMFLLRLLLTNLLAIIWVVFITLVLFLMENKMGGIQELEVGLEKKQTNIDTEKDDNSDHTDFEHVKNE